MQLAMQLVSVNVDANLKFLRALGGLSDGF